MRSTIAVLLLSVFVASFGCDKPNPDQHVWDSVRAMKAGIGDADLSCKTDADCTKVSLFLSGDYQCCPRCAPFAVNTEWAAEFTRECGRPRDDCPMNECAPVKPSETRCKAAQCVLEPSAEQP